jgi:hypothetical protein
LVRGVTGRIMRLACIGSFPFDWVGMSLYFWGHEYPWGENELAPTGRFAALLTGSPTGAHDGGVRIPDFDATYADGHDKPMAIIETAALYDPAAPGADEAAIKGAWFRQVFSVETHEAFPRIGMINWFEWRKDEPEVGTEIDWRLSRDSELGRALLESVPADWLLSPGIEARPDSGLRCRHVSTDMSVHGRSSRRLLALGARQR